MDEAPRRASSPLSRRTVLRGLGAAMALPWLESMVPDRIVLAGRRSFAGVATDVAVGVGSAGASPLRCAFVFIPNGVDPAAWLPAPGAEAGELPSSLEPLAALRGRFSLLQGLAHRNAQALGDGPGDHARSAACFLTGAHPTKTAGSDIAAGVSIDQVLARRIGACTALPSLELGCEPALQSGNCDSGYSCAYSANISWRTPGQPMLKEISPRAVFERLFAVGPAHESAEALGRRLAARRSILDYARSDALRLRERLGTADRGRLEEYLDGLRALERRIESIERARGGGADDARPAAAARPSAIASIPSASHHDHDAPELDAAAMRTPPGVPEDYREHVRLMNDLLVLAFKADRTRVASFMLANEGSNRSFPFLGVAEGHHHLSHHGGDASMIEKVRRINRFQCELFADLLAKLDGCREGDGTLLDRSMVVFGSAIADGNRHNHDDLPVILAGGGAGTLSPGRNIRTAAGTPMCNLFVSMLRRAGLDGSFGDSTGEIAGI